MSCKDCPAATKSATALPGSPRPIRARVSNYTEEKALMAKYPGYHVRRQSLGSNTTVLILTKP
jgi:hypothetical protein